MKSKLTREDLPSTLRESQNEIKRRHKPWYTSKTLYANTALLSASLFEVTREYLSANPEQAVTVAAVLNILLRLVTKEELTLRRVASLDDELLDGVRSKKS